MNCPHCHRTIVIHKTVNLDYLFTLVKVHFGITNDQIKGKCRRRNFVLARQMFCYLAKMYSTAPLSAMAAMMNRDHTTAIHSINVVRNLLDTDDVLVTRDLRILESMIAQKDAA